MNLAQRRVLSIFGALIIAALLIAALSSCSDADERELSPARIDVTYSVEPVEPEAPMPVSEIIAAEIIGMAAGLGIVWGLIPILLPSKPRRNFLDGP